jgi:SAM-dependent methyltransferase
MGVEGSAHRRLRDRDVTAVVLEGESNRDGEIRVHFPGARVELLVDVGERGELHLAQSGNADKVGGERKTDTGLGLDIGDEIKGECAPDPELPRARAMAHAQLQIGDLVQSVGEFSGSGQTGTIREGDFRLNPERPSADFIELRQVEDAGQGVGRVRECSRHQQSSKDREAFEKNAHGPRFGADSSGVKCRAPGVTRVCHPECGLTGGTWFFALGSPRNWPHSELMSTGYTTQDRGSENAYADYFAGMNQSMRQKVALISAYFPTRGRIADMGSGSGQGSYDLARLYPGLEVVGVDINPVTVGISRDTHRLPNLKFQVGDIADAVFQASCLDGILNSSVLHHVTSFNGFSRQKLEELFCNQVHALKPGGVLAIRDFLAPPGCRKPGVRPVLLDLFVNDGAPEGEPGTLSTAALFERFCATFRCFHHPEGAGIPFEKCPGAEQGMQRYRVEHRMAVEFLLRKDYRDDWQVELQEEYLYYDQEEFEEAVHRHGLKLVLSRPIWNPWIVQNRFEGKCRLRDERGRELPWPATNYLVVAEKPASAQAVVGFREESLAAEEKPAFLKSESYRDKSTGQLWDLISRPGPVFDIIPYMDSPQGLQVAARQAFPRPILTAQDADPSLDGVRTNGSIVEPISVRADSGTSPVEAVRTFAPEFFGQSAEEPGTRPFPGLQYLPSAGGLGEEVHSVLLPLNALAFSQLPLDRPAPSGLSGAISIRALDAQQTLRACQVGGMLDSRLEVNLYHLCLRLGKNPGPWIGADLAAGRVFSANATRAPQPLALRQTGTEVFERGTESSGFSRLHASRFVEVKPDGRAAGSLDLEFMLPRRLSSQSVSVLLFRVQAGDVEIGLEWRALPAVQKFARDDTEKSARIACVPAWRLPREILSEGRTTVERWLEHGLAQEFDISNPGLFQDLGGAYCPAPGATPELLLPLALELDPGQKTRALEWVGLASLVRSRERIRDGHLLISALRLAHALGVLEQ